MENKQPLVPTRLHRVPADFGMYDLLTAQSEGRLFIEMQVNEDELLTSEVLAVVDRIKNLAITPLVEKIWRAFLDDSLERMSFVTSSSTNFGCPNLNRIAAIVRLLHQMGFYSSDYSFRDLCLRLFGEDAESRRKTAAQYEHDSDRQFIFDAIDHAED